MTCVHSCTVACLWIPQPDMIIRTSSTVIEGWKQVCRIHAVPQIDRQAQVARPKCVSVLTIDPCIALLLRDCMHGKSARAVKPDECAGPSKKLEKGVAVSCRSMTESRAFF